MIVKAVSNFKVTITFAFSLHHPLLLLINRNIIFTHLPKLGRETYLNLLFVCDCKFFCQYMETTVVMATLFLFLGVVIFLLMLYFVDALHHSSAWILSNVLKYVYPKRVLVLLGFGQTWQHSFFYL